LSKYATIKLPLCFKGLKESWSALAGKRIPKIVRITIGHYVTTTGNIDLVENNLTSSLDIVQVKKILTKASDILTEELYHHHGIIVRE
jgi:hypothetical protein